MKHYKIAGISIFCFFLATQFINCSGGGDSSVYDQLNQPSLGCENGGCVGNENLLELSIQDGDSGFSIASNIDRFAVSGLCNAAGFEDNVIGWRIVINGQEAINSNTAGGVEFFGRCVGGQYSVMVRLPCPGVTNSANSCYGLRQSALLEVEIFGSQNGQFLANPNSNISRKAANLSPGQ